MQQETFHWPHKDLLDVDQLTQEELFHLLDTAANLHEINSRPVKKVPILKGKSVVLFFAEPSTRTKTSFDMAGKRLSADTFGLAKSGSSLQKGESMKDTALTLQAMNPDVIVIRHSSSGAAQFLAERLHCGVVNAGDGWHAHPTQALLDAFSLRQVWGHDRSAFKGKNLLILGDCAHSRVCRSNVLLLTKLGVNVSLCAPRTLLPAGVDNWPVTVYTDSKKAVRDMDAVMAIPFWGGRVLDYPGAEIFLTLAGRRFTDETGTWQSVLDDLSRQGEKEFWVITDGRSRKGATFATKVQQGTVGTAQDLSELAIRMGIPANALRAEMEKYNRAADLGRDEEFGRTRFTQRIETPPFYFGRERFDIHYTCGGVAINAKAEVKNAEDLPIAGLYAAGEVTGGVHGNFRLGGNGLTDAFVFGRKAGQSAAIRAKALKGA